MKRRHESGFERFRKAVRRHYGLKRRPTDDETRAELAMLYRRGRLYVGSPSLVGEAVYGCGYDVPLEPVQPLPSGPCPDGLYRADSGEIVRIHHGRPEPAF